MNNLLTYSKTILFCSFFLWSCEKNDFRWNLLKAPEIGNIVVDSNSEENFELSANFISTGNDENAEMGFCWSPASIPTIHDSIIPVVHLDKGVFRIVVPWTNKSTYYFRAFIKNELGIVYSENCIVNWPGNTNLPQVQTLSVDQISFHSFTVNCKIISNGGNNIINKGVKIYDSPILPNSSPVNSYFSNSSDNNYSHLITNMIDGNTYYVQAFVSTLAGYAVGNTITITLPKKYNIGDVGPANGYIIYENPDPYGSWHYLEVAPTDISGNPFVWSPNIDQTNVSSVEVGYGFSNTVSINSIYWNSTNFAAHAAKNWSYGGYSNWYLPSFYELKLIKEILFDNGFGNFSNGSIYWSSSEDYNYYTNAWTIKMSNSGQNLMITQPKNQSFKVRAIRRF